MSDLDLFASTNPLSHHLILIFSPSDASYRLLERNLTRLPQTEIRWHSETIEALADLFMSRPGLLMVFGDTNAETMEFIQLVRNNHQFREQAIFAILPEPQRLRQKIDKRQKIERFSTPIDGQLLLNKTLEVLNIPASALTSAQQSHDPFSLF